MDQTVILVFNLAVLILSVVIHEVSHGLMANRLGDPTAKDLGRLSFNPLKHLDFMGSFLVPLLLYVSRVGIIFGWAKPVPYNPYNLKNQNWGPGLGGGGRARIQFHSSHSFWFGFAFCVRYSICHRFGCVCDRLHQHSFGRV